MFDISVGVASNAVAITPDDDNDTNEIGVLYIGGAGDVTVVVDAAKADNQGDFPVVTFSAIPAGSWLPIRVKRVMATDTTATNIVQVW